MVARSFVETCTRVSAADPIFDNALIRFKPTGEWPILTQSAEGVDTNEAKWGRISRFYSRYASSCTILAGYRTTDGKCFLAHVVGYGSDIKTGAETFKLAGALRGFIDANDPSSDVYRWAMFTQPPAGIELHLWEKRSIQVIVSAIQKLTHTKLRVAHRTTIVTGLNGASWTVTSSGVAIGPTGMYCFLGDGVGTLKPLLPNGGVGATGDDNDRNLGSYQGADQAGRADL